MIDEPPVIHMAESHLVGVLERHNTAAAWNDRADMAKFLGVVVQVDWNAFHRMLSSAGHSQKKNTSFQHYSNNFSWKLETHDRCVWRSRF